MHVIAVERAVSRGDDSFVNNLVKAVDGNTAIAQSCNLFAHTKRKQDPDSDVAVENAGNRYLRRLFVSIDTDNEELLTEDERLGHLLVIGAVSNFDL
jgi:hypothetical protein